MKGGVVHLNVTDEFCAGGYTYAITNARIISIENSATNSGALNETIQVALGSIQFTFNDGKTNTQVGFDQGANQIS